MFNYQDGGFVSLDNSNWVGFTVPILPFKCNCGYYILTFRLTITLWLLYSHLSSYHYFMVIIFSPFVLPLLYGYYILTFRLTITLWLLYSHLSSYHYFMVIIFSPFVLPLLCIINQARKYNVWGKLIFASEYWCFWIYFDKHISIDNLFNNIS
jgi:hypothetical protein